MGQGTEFQPGQQRTVCKGIGGNMCNRSGKADTFYAGAGKGPFPNANDSFRYENFLIRADITL